jgi:hypothetical protein
MGRIALALLLLAMVAGASVALRSAEPAAARFASPFGCQPHSGLGEIALARTGRLRVVDLASCRDRVIGKTSQGRVEFDRSGRAHLVPYEQALLSGDRRLRATIRASGNKQTLRNSIWVTDARTGEAHPAYSVGVWGDTHDLHSPGPIQLLGWSGDDRWIFFAIDPGSSSSIAADGLILQVVAAAGGTPTQLGIMLRYRDYLAWCGGELVFSGGPDRIAIHGKSLLYARPPAWRPQPLVSAPARSWGSLACQPDGSSLVAQSQRSSTNANFFGTHWALWRVGLDGSQRQLTRPPGGYADESPRFSRDGRQLLFVRSHLGRGKLYILRAGRVTGPLLSLGVLFGWYGHRDWWQSMAWSHAPES